MAFAFIFTRESIDMPDNDDIQFPGGHVGQHALKFRTLIGSAAAGRVAVEDILGDHPTLARCKLARKPLLVLQGMIVQLALVADPEIDAGALN